MWKDGFGVMADRVQRTRLLEGNGPCGRYATHIGRHIGVLGAGFVSALYPNSASGVTVDAALWLVMEAVRNTEVFSSQIATG